MWRQVWTTSIAKFVFPAGAAGLRALLPAVCATCTVAALLERALLPLTSEIRRVHERLEGMARLLQMKHHRPTSSGPNGGECRRGAARAPICVNDRDDDHNNTNAKIVNDEFLHVKCYEEHSGGFFVDTRAGDLVYDRAIVRVLDTDSVTQTLNEMRQKDVTCAMVMMGASRDDPDLELAGIVDAIDIVRFLLSARSADDEGIIEVVRQCVLASPTTFVSDIVAHLKEGRRYVAVRHAGGEHTLISQGSILRHVFQHVADDSRTIADGLMMLALGRPPQSWRLITCTSSSTAREAFASMAAYSISSVPIIDDEGRLLDVISARHALYATHDSIERNVLEYVRSTDTSRDARCVHFSPDDTIATVSNAMVRENMRQVYIVVAQKPVGVISFVDMLRMCV